MVVAISFILAVAGAIAGSFAGAQVWRFRVHQLDEQHKAGDKADAKEYKQLKPLLSTSWKTDRSIDFETGTQLAWYDLIPIISWVMLRGRSRYSGKSIGVMELLLEVGLAAAFVVSYLVWPFGLEGVIGLLQFTLWLIGLVVMAILVAYDARWSLLPSALTSLLIMLGAGYALLEIATASDMLQVVMDTVFAALILSGLYLVLWYISKQRWIGFGDVVLGLGLALFLTRWDLAFLALFLANVSGLIAVVPGLLVKKLSQTSRIPFGPFLVLGAIIALLWGDALILGGMEVMDKLTYRLWYT